MPLNLPLLTTDRLTIRLATKADVPQILHYFRTNQAFLQPFEPIHPPNFLTIDFWQIQVESNLIGFEQDQSCRFFLFLQNSNTVIGSLNLSSIVRGAFQACSLGYSLAEAQQGQGYMSEALRSTLDYAFDCLKLHRIMANYMPDNQRSGRVLRRLGFVIEGYARNYLFINGKWEDHVLTSLTHPNW